MRDRHTFCLQVVLIRLTFCAENRLCVGRLIIIPNFLRQVVDYLKGRNAKVRAGLLRR